jgi:hypothetical protein
MHCGAVARGTEPCGEAEANRIGEKKNPERVRDAALPEDGNRCELANGRLEPMPPALLPGISRSAAASGSS